MQISNITEDDLVLLVRIHSQLEPENLAADGERSRSEMLTLKSQLESNLLAIGSRLQLSPNDLDESVIFAEHARRLDLKRRGTTPSFKGV